MKKKLLVLVLSAVMAVGMMSGCGVKSDTSDTKAKTAENSSAKKRKQRNRQSVSLKTEPTQQSSKLTAECFM